MPRSKGRDPHATQLSVGGRDGGDDPAQRSAGRAHPLCEAAMSARSSDARPVVSDSAWSRFSTFTPARVEFERFESAASRIMARYGGTIERRIQLASDGARRPSASLARRSARGQVSRRRVVRALSRRRRARGTGRTAAVAIRETVVWQGVEAPPFAEDQEAHP